jgi:DNA-binding NtrC family response regulator
MLPKREILHVDDDPQITRLIAKQLKARGYNVRSLNDPDEAINELIYGKQRVVLLEIDMPGTNGLELLHQIKEYDGGIQVIMLSGLVTVSNALQALRGGAEACFFKPVDNIEPIVEDLDAAFRKIDRWWEALRELSRRKRSLAGQAAEEPATV